ncbi:unnamed protein product [Discosporangium mesarthrocarpum]
MWREQDTKTYPRSPWAITATSAMSDMKGSSLGTSLLRSNRPPEEPDVLSEPLSERTSTIAGKSTPRYTGRSVRAALLDMAMTSDDSPSTLPQWKLTRAVIHLEDAWKGRVGLCPSLEDEDRRSMFKLRWKLRSLDFYLVHVLLLLSFIEQPPWCTTNGKCSWKCFPDFLGNWYLLPVVALSVEAVIVAFLVVGAVLDLRLRLPRHVDGQINGESLTMRVKHVILAMNVVDLVVAVTFGMNSFRIAGYLRFVLYLCMHRRSTRVVLQLRHILAAVLDIWVLIFATIALFAWMGVVLFGGTDEGTLFFPNIFEAGWRLLVLFTTTNFPSIMLPAIGGSQPSILFFLVFVILAVFFLGPLSLAFIFNVFRGGQRGIHHIEESIRVTSTLAAFHVLDTRGHGKLSVSTLGLLLVELHSMRGISFGELSCLEELVNEAVSRQPEKRNEPVIEIPDFQVMRRAHT